MIAKRDPEIQRRCVFTKDENVSLTCMQKSILDTVLRGENVFLTGSAGVGKSFLLRRCIHDLKMMHGSDRVAVVTPTGIAATQIHGTTIHSFFSIGIVRRVSDFQRMTKKKTKSRIKKLKTIVVDEISMVSADMFEHLERSIREIKCDARPFGGIQLLVSGDFFQLPPVPNRIDKTDAGAFANQGFAFQAKAWKRCAFHSFVLQKVFRQEDETFIAWLNKIRTGKDIRFAISHLRTQCMRPLSTTDGIRPTRLFPFNRKVDTLNESELNQLPFEDVVFRAIDTTRIVDEQMTQSGTLSSAKRMMSMGEKEETKQLLQRSPFWKECPAPETLILRTGAQVMLIRNLDTESQDALVNGSRGVVLGFVSSRDKTQTLIDHGPGSYVIPMVRFANGREELIDPVDFTQDVPSAGQCIRIQIPLKLAWALTIHKCQGLSLDKCTISLQGAFDCGQAYVALSRVRSLEGLELTSLSKHCVKTHPDVVRFYEELEEHARNYGKSVEWNTHSLANESTKL